MEMDPELKALLAALVEGQLKHDERFDRLADGQAKMQESIGKLTNAVMAGHERLDRVEEGLERLDSSVERLAESEKRLFERLDRFGEQVMRGFTRGAEADRTLEDRVVDLEARMTKLIREHGGKPPPKPRKRR